MKNCDWRKWLWGGFQVALTGLLAWDAGVSVSRADWGWVVILGTMAALNAVEAFVTWKDL